MARTPSTMLPLGTKAPNFALLEPITGNTISLSDFSDQPLLVAFICNHCPYVILIKEALAKFADDYQHKGLRIVAINSNDIENYPDDSPEKMMEDVRKFNYNFPYLFDENQKVAHAYNAACTPDFFLFNDRHELYYRGQFDSARPNSGIPVTGKDMINAADSLLANEASPENQVPSLGCGIKWKQGNAPNYSI